jgi:hypothetical protein
LGGNGRQGYKLLENFMLRLGDQRGRGFVQDVQGDLAYEGAGNGYLLI